MEQKHKRSSAQMMKDEGNAAFKQGNYRLAIEHYTAAMKADPSDHVLPCNRAMARLKIEQWKLAEADCTRSLDILPEPNCKALFRRGMARRHLQNWAAALEDLKFALAFEPTNPSIRAELTAVELHYQDITQKSPSDHDGDKPSKSTDTVTPSQAKSTVPSSCASNSGSDSSDAQSPAGPSSSALLDTSFGRPSHTGSTGWLREVSTTRFTGLPRPRDAPSHSFGALKQLRQKKEHKPRGLKNDSTPFQNPLTNLIHEDRTQTSPKSSENPQVRLPNAIVSPIGNFAEFERRWAMSNQPEIRSSVLQALKPQMLPLLFGEHLEPTTLEQILEAMDHILRFGKACHIAQAARLLEGLDGVSRLGTLTMFLDPKHKQVVRDILTVFRVQESSSTPIELKNWSI